MKPMDRRTAQIAKPSGLVKALLYARVSSKEQEKEGFSIPAQCKLLREYAVQRQFGIIQEYVDVETAKSSGRTNFNEMVKYLRKHPAYAVDRLLPYVTGGRHIHRLQASYNPNPWRPYPALTIRNPSSSAMTGRPFHRSMSCRTINRPRSPPISVLMRSMVFNCSQTLPTALFSGA